MTAKYGTIHSIAVNSLVINGSHLFLVQDPMIHIVVNQDETALFNVAPINSGVIGGTTANVHIAQTHIISAADSHISISIAALADVYAQLNSNLLNTVSINGAIVPAGEIVPEMRHIVTPANAYIVIVANKVMVKKGQGGHLFVTVEKADTTKFRFSFEGVRA